MDLLNVFEGDLLIRPRGGHSDVDVERRQS